MEGAESLFVVRVHVEGEYGNVDARARRKTTDNRCNCVGQSATHDSCLGVKAKLRAYITTNLVWIPSQVKYFSRIVQDFFVQIPASTALAWSTTGGCIEYVHALSLGKSGHGTTVGATQARTQDRHQRHGIFRAVATIK